MSNGVVCCLSEDFCDGFKISKSTLLLSLTSPSTCVWDVVCVSLVRIPRSFRPSGSKPSCVHVSQFTYPLEMVQSDIDIDGHPHSGIPLTFLYPLAKVDRSDQSSLHNNRAHPPSFAQDPIPLSTYLRWYLALPNSSCSSFSSSCVSTSSPYPVTPLISPLNLRQDPSRLCHIPQSGSLTL